MTESFDFPELEFLTVGTLGPLGQREFYLQARAEGRLISLKIEKQQVAALADYLNRALDDLPDAEVGEAQTDLGLHEPVVAEWRVGGLAIAYAPEVDRLIVVAESLIESEDEEPAEARFSLRRAQVAGLIDRAREIVAAGRPPCIYCGSPLEARTGDWCPCQN